MAVLQQCRSIIGKVFIIFDINTLLTGEYFSLFLLKDQLLLKSAHGSCRFNIFKLLIFGSFSIPIKTFLKNYFHDFFNLIFSLVFFAGAKILYNICLWTCYLLVQTIGILLNPALNREKRIKQSHIKIVLYKVGLN